MTDPGSVSWLPLSGRVESSVDLSLHLQGWTHLYIYNPERLSALALLSVSKGPLACSPSVATGCYSHVKEERWPNSSRLGINLLYSS